MSRVELSGFAEFVEAVKRAGLSSVVLRVVDEVRPRVLAGHRVEVGPQRFAELLAYQGGAILAARVDDADGDALEERLESEGLAVRRVSGNIT